MNRTWNSVASWRRLIVVAALAWAPTAVADTVTLQATSDVTLYSEADDKANGAGDYVFVGQTNGGKWRRTVQRFDVSGIPAGSTITSATLTLHMSRTVAGNQTLRLHRVLQDWGEGASNAGGEEGDPVNAMLNDATWRYRFYDPNNQSGSPQWTTLGGAFVAGVSASTVVGNVGFYSWSSAGMVSDVQAWLNNSAGRFGWIMIGNETANMTAKRFDSRTNPTVARRPVLTVVYNLPTGACCFANGTCQVLTQSNCTAQGGMYQGNGTSCTPNPCPQPTGACCFANGTCQVLTQANCTAQSGTYQGNGTSCTPNPCPQPTGACCFSNGTCQVLTQANCVAQAGVYAGNGVPCTPNPCIQPTGACCFGDGSCLVRTSTDCAAQGGTYQGNGTTCSPNPCPQPTGACCFANGSCQVLTQSNCTAQGGTYHGNGTSCTPNPCPQPTGACCFADGTCQVLTQSACTAQSGTYQGNGTSCTPNPCPQPTGACCFADGTCQVLTQSACTAQSGVYQGNSTSCTPNPCPQPTGACCLSSGVCVVLTAANCTAQNGAYQGDNVPCSGVTCPILLTPFVDPLPRPAVAQPLSGVPGGAAHYQLDMLEVTQQLHRDLPATRVWGYAGAFPGPTIEARRDLPVTVVWRNQLRDPQGVLRTTHYLPVDTCLHGPNHTGLTPVAVVHLHGGKVAPESDGMPNLAFAPGEQSPLYTYPNDQPASTIWYHDHTLGNTRLNVYMGLAGFYLIRDSAEDALSLPGGEYEIPLAIQDRAFNPDGTLRYLSMWHEHFFGDFVLVNGKVWPYLDVKRGKYRFRLLNGSNSRTYTLALSNGASFSQISTDLGLLPAPVPLTSLTLTPGERADVVIDFAPYAAGTEIVLTNSAAAPYPNGPPESVIPNVMKFIVTNQIGNTNALPAALVPVPPIPEGTATVTRDFQLIRMFDPTCNHDMWTINELGWHDLTEFPMLGATEIWQWINRSGVTHPMHMHLVAVQILDRQAFTVVNDQIVPFGPRVPPPPHEAGWKDTVAATPNQITRVITRFEGFLGRYAYHCHILEHEDHEMMRQFEILCPPIDITAQPQPDSAGRGCTASFSVAADSGVLPLSYQWRRNGVPLVNGPRISGATSATLSISGVMLGDAGSYTCAITTQCGNAVSNAAGLAICVGDLNCNGTVDLSDLSTLLSNFGIGSGATPAQGDTNADGAVDLADLSTLLGNFGAVCL
jgi:spore coat protein A, manganese oxidase